MTRLQIAAFFQKFPFLGKIIPQDTVTEIRESFVDERLLDQSPSAITLCHNAATSDRHAWQRYILVDRNGSILAETGITRTQSQRWFRPILSLVGIEAVAKELRFPETVYASIARLKGKANEISFIAFVDPINFDTTNYDRGLMINRLTVFKLPPDRTFLDWIDHLVHRHAT